jgi:hypothetical protein
MTRAAKASDTIAEFGALVEFSLPGASGDALRVSRFSTTLPGSFSIHRFGSQFDTSLAMTKAYVTFFGVGQRLASEAEGDGDRETEDAREAGHGRRSFRMAADRDDLLPVVLPRGSGEGPLAPHVRRARVDASASRPRGDRGSRAQITRVAGPGIGAVWGRARDASSTRGRPAPHRDREQRWAGNS